MIMHHVVFFSSLSSVFFLFVFCSDFTMRKLNAGSLNINGGRDSKKRVIIAEISAQKHINVLFLQETHSTASDEVDWGLWWRGPHALSHGSNVSAGVAVLFTESINATIISVSELVKGRLLIVRAEIESTVLVFVNVYAPNQGSERVRFFILLENELKNYQQDQLIIGGDFNCTLDFTVDRTSEEPHPQSSQTLNSLIAKQDLSETWRIKHPQARQYSWMSVRDNRVTAARMDMFLISQNLRSRLSHSNISPVGFTDHHRVSIELVISPGERVKSYWCFNNKLLQDTAFCQAFEIFWQQWKNINMNLKWKVYTTFD